MEIKTNWLNHLKFIRTWEIELIFKNFPPNLEFEKILELGGGDGFQANLLSHFSKTVISTDFNPSILKNTSTNKVRYEVCDAERVENKFQEQSFDLIFSSNMLEHLPDIQRALKGMSFCLKNNGLMIHVVPSVFWKWSNVLLYHFNLLIVILEAICTKGGISSLENKYRRETDENVTVEDIGNNPKLKRRQKTIFNLLFPKVHGVSANNFKEFKAFRKKRWQIEFQNCGLEIVNYKKGPVNSGYGFGWNVLRRFLYSIGYTSEHIFILKKKGESPEYQKYFE